MNGLASSERPAGASATLAGDPAGHGVRAHGAVQIPSKDVATLRQTLGPPGGPPFPATFLKPVEEQTVAAVAAVLRAIEDFGLQGQCFGDWGAVGAPRSLARLAAASVLHKFQVGGAWKVSPLLAAHHSLHSIAGTVSLAFHLRGPNFGVGGSSGAVVEGMLAALALLDEQRLPGLWLVLTECDPEPLPDDEGVSLRPVVYHAVALGFMPVATDWQGLRLRLVNSAADVVVPCRPTPSVAELARFLAGGSGPTQPGKWSCPLTWGCTLELGHR